MAQEWIMNVVNMKTDKIGYCTPKKPKGYFHK